MIRKQSGIKRLVSIIIHLARCSNLYDRWSLRHDLEETVSLLQSFDKTLEIYLSGSQWHHWLRQRTKNKEQSTACRRSAFAWLYSRLLTTFAVLLLHFGLMGSFIVISYIMHLYNCCDILGFDQNYVMEQITHRQCNSKWPFREISNKMGFLVLVYSL